LPLFLPSFCLLLISSKGRKKQTPLRGRKKNKRRKKFPFGDLREKVVIVSVSVYLLLISSFGSKKLKRSKTITFPEGDNFPFGDIITSFFSCLFPFFLVSRRDKEKKVSPSSFARVIKLCFM
jgi:hypothetical protein